MLNILLSPKVAIFHNDSFGVDLLKIAVTKAVPVALSGQQTLVELHANKDVRMYT